MADESLCDAPRAMTAEEQAQWRDACAFINTHPAVASLLFDMDLMPEQAVETPGGHGWNWLFKVVTHARALLEAEREAIAFEQGSGKFCRWVDHHQDMCECEERTAAIRARRA